MNCTKNFVPLHKICTMPLPQNPDMLVSFVNMKLRDEYHSLEELCDDLELNIDELCQNLRNAGYQYSHEYKRFW